MYVHLPPDKNPTVDDVCSFTSEQKSKGGRMYIRLHLDVVQAVSETLVLL